MSKNRRLFLDMQFKSWDKNACLSHIKFNPVITAEAFARKGARRIPSGLPGNSALRCSAAPTGAFPRAVFESKAAFPG